MTTTRREVMAGGVLLASGSFATLGPASSHHTNRECAMPNAANADAQWSNAGEPDSGAAWEAHDGAIAREFETFRKLFETFPTTAAEAAALFERLAQPLFDDDDFTVIEHAVELWKGGGGYLPAAKEWAAQWQLHSSESQHSDPGRSLSGLAPAGPP